VTPLILAIDTTHQWGSLALARGVEIAGEVELESPDGFAHVVYGHLQALLERNAVNVRDVDCFASAAGPGSFTGVRVGLACVKGLAEACGKPAVAVSNLEAMASLGSVSPGSAPLRAAVMDARRGEVYGAVYDSEGRIVVPEVVAGFAAWLETVPPGNVEFVYSGFTAFGELIAGTRWECAPALAAPRALAAAIARIAACRLARGEAQDPAALDANYVRRADAELLWKE
jgi:tRNA threonylcarbamoyladenosine biosynthesis protein TsaB